MLAAIMATKMEYEDNKPLVSEKFKEIMAAKKTEADMDVALSLQRQEIDRYDYEQERRDLELCQVAVKKIKQDLSIRLHDRSQLCFEGCSDSRSRSAIIWGLDTFQEPYGVGSSSSTKAEKERFRLYLKGVVVNLGTSNNKLKKVGAIGLALCDPRDNVIFELSKPLIVDEREMNEEMAEVEALVQGLNACFRLGFEKCRLLLSQRDAPSI